MHPEHSDSSVNENSLVTGEPWERIQLHVVAGTVEDKSFYSLPHSQGTSGSTSGIVLGVIQ